MPSPSHLITALALACCAAVPARADIVKCQDRDGNLTLTDTGCAPGSVQIQVVARTPPPPTVAPRLAEPAPDERGVARVILHPAEFAPRRTTALRPPAPRPHLITPPRLFATDAATLKAARMALILGESPAKIAGR